MNAELEKPMFMDGLMSIDPLVRQLRDESVRSLIRLRTFEIATRRSSFLIHFAQATQIMLMLLATAGAIYTFISPVKSFEGLTAILAGAALAIQLLVKSLGWESQRDRNRTMVVALRPLRERYRILINEIHGGMTDTERIRRDSEVLAGELNGLYAGAPETTRYQERKALLELNMKHDAVSDADLARLLEN